MSKELPYFKFYPNEWLSSDAITFPLEYQGLYINILAYYWKKECQLTKRMLSERFLTFQQSLNECLEKCKTLQVIEETDDGKIIIKFLDKQYSELLKKCQINAENGRKGGLQKVHKANAKRTLPDLDSERLAFLDSDSDIDIEKKNNTNVLLKEKVANAPVVSSETPQTTKFFLKKPSEEDVMKYGFAYFADEFDVDEGQAFYDHFESNGWKVSGKTPMKDWQAALRNWHRNQERFKKRGKI